MLAERFASLASQIELTAILVRGNKEISAEGYKAQRAKFVVTGNQAKAEATFTFSGPARFDAVEWREGDMLLRRTPVSYDGPAGSHKATLEVEVAG